MLAACLSRWWDFGQRRFGQECNVTADKVQRPMRVKQVKQVKVERRGRMETTYDLIEVEGDGVKRS